MIWAKTVLIVGWSILGAGILVLGRRRPADPDWLAPWYLVLPTALLWFACMVGTAIFFLYRMGIRGDRLFRVLVLQDDAWETGHLRLGLAIAYVLFAFGVIAYCMRARRIRRQCGLSRDRRK